MSIARIARKITITLLAPFVVLAALVVVPSSARARSTDVVSAHSLVRAELRLWQAEHANLAQSQAELNAFDAELSTGCPGALTGAPNSPAVNDIAFEIGGALVFSTQHSDKAALLTYSSSVMRLRWSDPKLRKSVRALARVRAALATVYEPAAVLCNHILAVKASNYQTTPPGTIEFLAGYLRVATLAKQAEHGPALSLSPSDLIKNKRAQALEKKVAAAQSAQAQAAVVSVLTALGAS